MDKFGEFKEHLRVVRNWDPVWGRHVYRYHVMIISSYAGQPYERHWLYHYTTEELTGMELKAALRPSMLKAMVEVRAAQKLWDLLNEVYPQGLDEVIFH